MRTIHKLSALIPAFALSFGQAAASSPMPEDMYESATTEISQPFLIANPFRMLRDAAETIDDITDIDSVEDAAGVIYTIDQTIRAEERRRELEAARAAATEQQRLEAERRQRYFESLSPEEQQAYLEEQQALQAQQEQVATLFMLMMFSGMMSSESGGQQGGRTVTCDDGYGYYEVRLAPGEAPPHSGCS